MSVILWESQLKIVQASRYDLVRGLREQNYEIDDSAESLIVSPPKDFWKLIQNGSQLLIVDNIVIEMRPDRLRLKFAFNQALILLMGICCLLLGVF